MKNHSKFNINFDLEGYIQSLDPGLERAVSRVLQHRIGRDQAINGKLLLKTVRYVNRHVNDRSIRLVINLLRKRGVPVCSTGGVDGGYWIAASAVELDEFIKHELVSRISDLQEQCNALRKTQRQLWGEGVQRRLL
jgi:hypothetical protein